MVAAGDGGRVSLVLGAGSVTGGGRGHGAAVARVAASGGVGVEGAGHRALMAVPRRARAARVGPRGSRGVVAGWGAREPKGKEKGCRLWKRVHTWGKPGHFGCVRGARGASCGAAGYSGGEEKPHVPHGSTV